MSLSVQKDSAMVFTTQQDIRIKAVISIRLSVHEKQICVSCILSQTICNCGTLAKLQSQFSALFGTQFSLASSLGLQQFLTSLDRQHVSLYCLICNSHAWGGFLLITLEEARRQNSTSPPTPGLASHHQLISALCDAEPHQSAPIPDPSGCKMEIS